MLSIHARFSIKNNKLKTTVTTLEGQNKYFKVCIRKCLINNHKEFVILRSTFVFELNPKSNSKS